MTWDEILALEDRELDFAVDRHVFGGWRLYVPRYSSDIAAAWQVVERMRKRGLRPIIVSDWNEQWQCEVYRKSEWVAQSRWYNSAPRAICEAALLAVMGEAFEGREAIRRVEGDR